MNMTSRERMLTALDRKEPDRLPVTTHHIMEFFLEKYMDGISNREFFDHFGLDAYSWILPTKDDPDGKTWTNEYGFLTSDNWHITQQEMPDPQYETHQYTIHTPKGNLTTTLQRNEHTVWVTERLLKNMQDIDLLGEFMPAPICDVEAVNKEADLFGERGLCRSHIVTAEIFGQPGCWQDAACLYGIENLIFATYDDPDWVHTFLNIMLERKLKYVQTLAGAQYDLIEHGGGDASTTVISPKIFRNFVAPYDQQVIATAQEMGQRIVYHTCGGMMPILEDLADMGPDAIETLTPSEMGGDVDLAEVKRRVGDRVCMIGGFDQFHHFINCSEKETRAAVRHAFEAAGDGGGFILSPSDHFFDADLNLIQAFADEARACRY